jgi:hypothetical protein
VKLPVCGPFIVWKVTVSVVGGSDPRLARS